MKRYVALALGILCLASPLFAEEQKLPEIPTGLEWLQTSGMAREEGLLAALLIVRGSGVEIGGDFLEHHTNLQRYLLRHPEIQSSPLTDVVAAYAYETLPASRAGLDKLRVSGKTQG